MQNLIHFRNRKIIVLILVFILVQKLPAQVAWQQSVKVEPKIKKVVVEGVEYTLKSDHPKELEMLIAVKNLKEGDELSREQILTIYEIVLKRTKKVLGTRVYFEGDGVCIDYVFYVYEGLYPNLHPDSMLSLMGEYPGDSLEEPSYTCDPVPGMPIVWWYNEYEGHIAIFHSLINTNIGGGWAVLMYYDQNSGGREHVGLTHELVIKKDFCAFVKVFPYF